MFKTRRKNTLTLRKSVVNNMTPPSQFYFPENSTIPGPSTRLLPIYPAIVDNQPQRWTFQFHLYLQLQLWKMKKAEIIRIHLCMYHNCLWTSTIHERLGNSVTSMFVIFVDILENHMSVLRSTYNRYWFWATIFILDTQTS